MTINKTIQIGTMEVYEGKFASIYCKIEYDHDKLSISGVIGPTCGGNALGGCGQINMEFEHRNPAHNDRRYDNPIKASDIKFAPGWNKEKWFDFLEIWRMYHLNDMKAGCEHQRALDWGSKELVIYTYKLKMDTIQKQNKIKARAEKALLENNKAEITDEEKHILSLPYSIKLPGEQTEEYALMRAPLAEHYKFDSEEKKTAGWVYQKEHPEGVLCKKCPECGYEYGSSWKKSEVPKETLEFLANLPQADKEPAWV